jgi:hypothetical protein
VSTCTFDICAVGNHDAVLEQQAVAAAPLLPLYMAVVGRIAYRLCDDTSLCLSVSNLSLRTPDGMALICNNLSFQLRCGDRLLLCGPRSVALVLHNSIYWLRVYSIEYYTYHCIQLYVCICSMAVVTRNFLYRDTLAMLY